MTGKSRRGLTLVELLVVLVILASLAVTVSVSTSGMLERAHVDKTRLQGEAMRDAFEAHDGLSIVSDLGIGFLRGVQNSMTNTTDGTDTAPLSLLFSYRHPLEVVALYEGADPDVGTVFKEVAGYGVVNTTNTYRQIVADAVTNAVDFSKFGNSPVGFGGGWRGPYCSAKVMDADGQLRDGFGGTWRFGTNSTSRSSFSFSLVSLGRDRCEGGIDWADADAGFDVRLSPTTMSVSLEAPDGVSIVAYYAFCFEPSVQLTYSNTVEEDVLLRSVSTRSGEPVCTFSETDVTSDKAITPGLRLVSAVGVTLEGGVLHAPPRPVMIRPGSNFVELSLKME